MSYLKDREIWLSKVPTGNPPAGYFWKFIQNGKVVVRDSSGNDQMMIATSGSQAITGSLTVTEGITGTVSSASYVQYSNVANKPTLVSGSSQVTFLGLSSIPSGIVSGSAQVAQFGYATTGANGFNGSQSITGSLTVTGQVIAQTLNVQQVTSSIVYSSGSNIFGNNTGNTHRFTGSLAVTGSLSVNGASSFSSNVTATGNLNLQGAVTRNINFYDSSNTNINAQIQYDQISSTSGQLFFGTNNAGTFATRLTISNTGAATFSSTITTTGANINGDVLITNASNAQIGFNTTGALNSAGAYLYFNRSGSNKWTAGMGPYTGGNNYEIATGSVVALSLAVTTGVATFNNSVSGNALRLYTSYASGRALNFGFSDGSVLPTAAFYVGNQTAVGVYIGDETTTNGLYVKANSNVGIGTTSPDTNLTIEGTNRAFPLVYTTGHGNLHIQTNETTATQNFGGSLTFGALGRTSGPTEKFVFAAIAGRKETTTTGDPKGYLQFGTLYDDTNYINERMRITSGGTVYINTTTNPLPDNATAQLGIIGGAGTDAVSIKHTANGNNTFNIWQTGTTTHNAIAFYKGDTQSSRGNITVSTSGTTYNSVSDYRLKENIVPIENGIDRLMQLKPSKFNWIETGNEAEGFIAHELQEIFPDAVTGEKDAIYSSTGNIKPQSVDYGRITPLLVKALQEQQTLIESLKSRIEILEQ